jgi:hypothetical protein
MPFIPDNKKPQANKRAADNQEKNISPTEPEK